MRYYATITSERASKGQGANKFLRIKLLVGNSQNQTNAGVIEITETIPNKIAINYHLNGNTKLLQEINTKGTVFEIKGKSQKDEQPDGYCHAHGCTEKAFSKGAWYCDDHTG